RAALDFLMKNTRENQRARATAQIAVNWTNYNAETPEVSSWMKDRVAEIKSLGKEIKKLKGSTIDTNQMVQKATAIGHSGRLVFETVDLDDKELLVDLAARVRDQLQSGVVIIVGQGESFPLMVSVSKDRADKNKAGDILKTVTSVMGGKGGGRPDFAQGAVEKMDRMSEAKNKVLEMLS
ncbi:MAG: hypothetical protein K2X47_11660, partial [Bdellovibrionales bacterium]|nr:hypothetical protein [Bdellovibrionales bacterium]